VTGLDTRPEVRVDTLFDARPATTITPPRRAGRRAKVWERASVSELDRRDPRIRAGVSGASAAVTALLAVLSLGPLLWMVKASLSTSQEMLGDPLGWPAQLKWSNYADAWQQIGVGQYTLNSLALTTGTVVISVLCSTLIAYLIAVMRPRFARVIEIAVLITLFVPGVISLVPLYLTVIDLHLLNTYWAVWLPAGASAFSVLLIVQYLRGIPFELFEAARIDGAGPLRMFVSIVLPLSRPILGGVALLTFTASWKDYLWPLLAIPDVQKQPLAVALSRIAPKADQAILMAGMVIAVVIPLLIFLVFQRQFLQSAAATGAVKG